MPPNLPFSDAAASRRDAQFVRLAETQRDPLSFFIDGSQATALQGDTVLTAVLMHQRRVRESEFSGAPRAGFCLIGACQDCWMRTEDGTRLRACSTLVSAGMRVVTRLAEVAAAAAVAATATAANGDPQ